MNEKNLHLLLGYYPRKIGVYLNNNNNITYTEN